ncbi:hypothetical protein EYF80_011949 [Liparis tanakae]|uniref:Uncharacterized protein n=1 Tax=Liparis tanakae TaxID=230148 RepID=A0A4Z2IKY3_9TELE|nr:hypothetical protein EYF80_011949 [Liparis tanakae]
MAGDTHLATPLGDVTETVHAGSGSGQSWSWADHKAEDLGPGPAVELGFDPLRVCVRGQLLDTVLGDQKQCEGVRIRDLELSVPGLRAQHPRCLLLLEVLDEGHGSIGTGEYIFLMFRNLWRIFSIASGSGGTAPSTPNSCGLLALARARFSLSCCKAPLLTCREPQTKLAAMALASSFLLDM